MKVYNIIEIANTHGGNKEYLFSLIEQFKEFDTKFGIKFQPFKYDLIALKDFSYYPVYEQLYFEKKTWKEIIHIARTTKDVWLDMFDTYSVDILRENINNVTGIKLQASVLFNFEILKLLEKINLTEKKIILNIAGYSIPEINQILSRIKQQITPNEIIIQFGFQSYPTDFEDSGLSKIKALQKTFCDYQLCFADHLDGDSEDALIMPLIAITMGCTIIEKHVYLDTLETKFDKFSSLTYSNYKKLITTFEKYETLTDKPFISEKETEYLIKSIQIPICNKTLKSKTLICFENDITFKRTDKKGLNTIELLELIKNFYILTVDKNEGDVFYKEDFKKATIAAIVACRMKSSRLPQKAILNIGNITSIELCLKNVLKFSNINHVVLATSTTKEDKHLEKYTYNPSVIFHQGHPDDVIERFIEIVDKLEIDVVVRLTGDCPYLSKEIAEIILEDHFEKGAEYSSAPKACIGTNAEIFNASTLRKIKKYFPEALYSEYMTYYVTNNPTHFKINYVELAEKYIRDYRLTLDYPEDLALFNKIENYLMESNIEFTIENVFHFLDTNPAIANLNKEAIVLYKSDPELIHRINIATTIIS